MRLKLMATALLAIGTAGASILVPGGPAQFPDLFSASGEVTLLALASGTFTTPSPSAMGTFIDAVYRNTSGTLDFLYQFHVNTTSRNVVTVTSASDFTGFTTDVGFMTNGSLLPMNPGFVNGTVDPVFVARPVAASVGFFFGPNSANNINKGETSSTLVISTNATRFVAAPDVVGVSGGGPTTNVSGFEPVGVVPEPSVFLLTVGGLVGLIAWRRKTRPLA